MTSEETRYLLKKMSVAVLTGSYLFVAQNNSLVVTPQKSGSKSGTYEPFLVTCAEITEPIVELVANRSETHIAIRTESHVFVVEISGLQPPSIGSNPSSSVELAALRVQLSQKCRALKWHPLALHDFTLILLSSDFYIHLYELGSSFLAPAASVDLCGHARRARKLSFAVVDYYEIQDPTAITLGSTDLNDPVGCLTLYILSLEGAVYSLYPLHPPRMAVPELFLDKLRAIYSALVERESSIVKKDLYFLQAQWAEALHEQAQNAVSLYSVEDGHVIQRKIVSPITDINDLRLQGPLFLKPESRAVDICSIGLGTSSGLHVAFADGQIVTLVPSPGQIMQWHVVAGEPSEHVDGPDLHPIHHAAIQRPNKLPVLVPTCLPGVTFVLAGPCIRLDFTGVISSLKSGDSKKLYEHVIAERVATLADHVAVHKSSYAIISGKSVEIQTRDIELETSSDITESESEAIRKFEFQPKNLVRAEFLNAQRIYQQNAERCAAFTRDLLSDENVKKALLRKLGSFEGSKPGDSEAHAIEITKAVQKITDEVSKQILFLMKYQYDLGHVLRLYKEELESQLMKYVVTCEKLKGLVSWDVKSREERITKVVERQAKLDERLEKLREDLKKRQGPSFSGNLPISAAEKKFFKEMTKAKNRADLLKMNWKTMKDHVSFFKDHSGDLSASESTGVLTQEQYEYLEKWLKRDIDYMKRLEHSLERRFSN